MQHLVAAVWQSITTENWYAALALALTLPDVCAHLEDPAEKSIGRRYRKWCAHYLEPVYTHRVGAQQQLHTFMTAADAYALRCAVLHESTDDATTQERAVDIIERFEFVEPPAWGTAHRNGSTRLQLQVDLFCAEICTGVEQWLVDTANDPAVQSRLLDLMVIRRL